MKSIELYIKNRQSDEYTLVTVKKNFMYHSSDILSLVEWQPVYSDAYIIKDNEYRRYRMNIFQFLMLFLFSNRFQVRLPNNMIWYPFATRKGNLSFSYRSDNGFSSKKRTKQFWATIFASIMNFFKPFNRPQLAFEKLSNRAQESGFAYFKYVRLKFPNEKLYFLIKKDSPDFREIEGLGHIVFHGSFKHFYLLHRAELFISSETPGHAYFWRENMGITANVVRTKPYVFLQHGVLGFKMLDNLFYGDRLTAPILLITSSEFEQNIVVDQLGYAIQRAPVTGLARWDMIDLNTERTTFRDKILIFYTWRPWLDDVSEEKFRKSEYFLHLQTVLTNLNKNHYEKQIILMLHPKLQTILDKSLLLNVKLWTDSDGPLNELLSSVATIITDYSSVSWEAYYREIPVIFDMFDQTKYENEVGSYIDLDNLPFGIKLKASQDVTTALEKVIKNKYHLTPDELLNKKTYFSYDDGRSSERIYHVIKKMDLKTIRYEKWKSLWRAFFRIIYR